MILGTYSKQPADERDIPIDFADYLAEVGNDTLASATASANGAGLTVDSLPSVSATTVTVWVRGGTDGTTYQVTVTATTAGGRVKEVEFKVRVRDV